MRAVLPRLRSRTKAFDASLTSLLSNLSKLFTAVSPTLSQHDGRALLRKVAMVMRALSDKVGGVEDDKRRHTLTVCQFSPSLSVFVDLSSLV